MIPTRSASSAASSMSCVVRMRVTPRVAQLAQAVPDEQARGRVEAGRRLVEEEHPRRVHQRAGDHHPLRLSAGEQVGLVLARSSSPNCSSSSSARALALARWDAVVRRVEDQVVADRDRAVEVAALRHDRECATCADRIAHARRYRRGGPLRRSAARESSACRRSSSSPRRSARAARRPRPPPTSKDTPSTALTGDFGYRLTRSTTSTASPVLSSTATSRS